jgi:hypothetical protein
MSSMAIGITGAMIRFGIPDAVRQRDGSHRCASTSRTADSLTDRRCLSGVRTPSLRLSRITNLVLHRAGETPSRATRPKFRALERKTSSCTDFQLQPRVRTNSGCVCICRCADAHHGTFAVIDVASSPAKLAASRPKNFRTLTDYSTRLPCSWNSDRLNEQARVTGSACSVAPPRCEKRLRRGNLFRRRVRNFAKHLRHPPPIWIAGTRWCTSPAGLCRHCACAGRKHQQTYARSRGRRVA